MNRDESLKCMDIAVRKLEAGDKAGASKFAAKAASLHDSPEVQALIRKIAATSSGSAATPPTPVNASRPAAHRQHTQPKREYTGEQASLVARVRRCKDTAFYEILDCHLDASDAEVKKSYRKLALQLHPDKNGAPGADEAFKMVSRAFQVLSDVGKREQYDRYGADPDSRHPAPSGFSRRGGNNNGGGGMQGGQGNMFGEEINADDLFNMFFGGGGGLGGGQTGFASFGGPGMRMHQFGGGGRGNREQRRAAGPNTASWMQLLPLIVLFGFSVLSSLFSSADSFFGSNAPSYSFQQYAPYTTPRYTPTHKIPYWVHSDQVASTSSQNLAQLDKKAEVAYIRGLRENCEYEYQDRERKMNDAYGFFTVDREKYNAAKNMRMRHCEDLTKYGYRM